MKSLGKGIENLLVELSPDPDQARMTLRAHQVRQRYKAALETIYPKTAPVFLEHTNNVYIMKRDGAAVLIVYVDDSIYAAELNAQRELVRLRLLELFGEELDEFRICVSRGKYKEYHPYTDEEVDARREPPSQEALGPAEEQLVSATASKVEDDKVRKSLEKAMTADMARKKKKSGSLS